MDFFIEVDKEAFFFVLTVLGQLWEPLGLLVDVVESWRRGNTTIMEHYVGGFNVVVSFFDKHNLQNEFWADFYIEA